MTKYKKPSNEIESIIRSKKLLGKMSNLKRFYQKKGLWKYCDERVAISRCIKTLLCYISNYECSANVISKSFKQWYSRKILEENTNLPTDVINYCIFPYLFKETQILI